MAAAEVGKGGPATADVLAKFAQGIANDFLSTLYLATTAPVVVSPAMNVNMWNHAATQANLETLTELDINPVIVRPANLGAVAADALIRLAE